VVLNECPRPGWGLGNYRCRNLLLKIPRGSCTGHGEKILIPALGKQVINYLKHKKAANAMPAAKSGIEELNPLPAEGGLICIDKDGTIGYAYNAKFMKMH
jgi:isoaspartyl peptidase/L-asparaginase-like protein (Ntn-hydrolase superfamily)